MRLYKIRKSFSKDDNYTSIIQNDQTICIVDFTNCLVSYPFSQLSGPQKKAANVRDFIGIF